MTPLKEKQQNTAQLISDLKAIGLHSEQMEKQIGAFYDDPTGSPQLRIVKPFSGGPVTFELSIGFDVGNKLSLDAYSVVLPPDHPSPLHFIYNRINSAELEEKMKTIDWSKHPGSMHQKDYSLSNAELEKMDDVFKDMYRFGLPLNDKYDADFEKANSIIDYLTYTYFNNTPLQDAILEGTPYRSDIFFRHIDFPPHLRSGVPGNRATDITELEKLSALAYSENYQNKEIMNLNNLEDLKDEMKMLGFKDKLITQMEENMKKDVPDFRLHDTINATKGRVDLTLHFKQSGQSEFYYLNRFEAAQNKGKALEEGQKYWVVLPPKDGKPQIKGLEHAAEAIELFKAQKGDSELSIGKAFDGSGKVASMENGKVNYVAKDFQSTYYSQNLPQTFWVDHGKGFTAEQAVNLVQGRAVYRDDLLSRDGIPYKAWMQLDTDKARDRHNNLSFKQFNDPSYGFDLNKVLNSFKIRETEDPAKLEKLETALRNGNRPLVTAVKDGQEVKLYVEAAVRYGKLNFYDMDGKPEKRETLMKEQAKENVFDRKLAQGKDQQQSQSQGMRM